MNKKEIKERLKSLNAFPKKSLGQNFLINPQVSEKMADEIQLLNPSKIIEIGPGVGSLTEFLISLEIPLQLVEVDKKMAQYWKGRGIDVLEENALKLDKKIFPEKSSLVGNLPYHISNRLIVHSSIEWPSVQSMVFMVQKETADRIISPHGKKSFGSLSVITQYIWNIEKLLVVPSSDYYPPPKVDGCVLIFKRKSQDLIPVPPFYSFVKLCFAQKRKILLSKLKNQIGLKVIPLWDQLKLPPKARAEELCVKQFVQLYQEIKKFID